MPAEKSNYFPEYWGDLWMELQKFGHVPDVSLVSCGIEVNERGEIMPFIQWYGGDGFYRVTEVWLRKMEDGSGMLELDKMTTVGLIRSIKKRFETSVAFLRDATPQYRAICHERVDKALPADKAGSVAAQALILGVHKKQP